MSCRDNTKEKGRQQTTGPKGNQQEVGVKKVQLLVFIGVTGTS